MAVVVAAEVGVAPVTLGVLFPILYRLCKFIETGTNVALVGVDTVCGSFSFYCCDGGEPSVLDSPLVLLSMNLRDIC